MKTAADPLWYKDAVFYELHVRAFHDSDGDGIGDFRGLAEKLDYLQDLGVTTLWLLPFYPSPLRDDGYDISDYRGVHPSYGSLADFRHFLREAHDRGLKVVTELVLNHTSDQHPWFQRACRAPQGSPHRSFYVWSETTDRYEEARVIFKDFETGNWSRDPVSGSFYFHRFYGHQPDLNFESPAVRRAMRGVLDFWFEQGVDGLRLDAVPYLYERNGTSCENLPETHAFLRSLRHHLDTRFGGRMLLAEANQWPEDAAAYFGRGDECHMAFHFPLMPRLFMASHMEDRFPIVDILQQTPVIPDGCQWAIFLRNHDELTLEMVTDEERDYMYRVYAHDPQARINLGIRRRLAPLLGNRRRTIELMYSLLFSLPGTPVLYYGDEIGMGDNIYLGDRNGVRTPMQWSADRNAGFSRANPQRLYLPVIVDPEYHYETVNVEAQSGNPRSLLWWVKRMIALRRRFKAFSRGSLELLLPDNRKVLAFVRRHEDEEILVVANLSRFVQWVHLDLSAYAGRILVELFGRSELPAPGSEPYMLTLSPHGFYWFGLRRPAAHEVRGVTTVSALPRITVQGGWEKVLRSTARRALEEALPGYLREKRWFAGKARTVGATRILDAVPLPCGTERAWLTVIQVSYVEGSPEKYVIPFAFASADEARRVLDALPHSVVARISATGEEGEDGLLFDAFGLPDLSLALLEAIRTSRRRGRSGVDGGGRLEGFPTRSLDALWRTPLPEARLLAVEQSNTSVAFGESMVLKIHRRIEQGRSPEVEIGRFLTDQARFAHAPAFCGSLDYVEGKSEGATFAVLHGYVPSQEDAWSYTLDEVRRFFDRAAAAQARDGLSRDCRDHVLDRAAGDAPRVVTELVGPFLESIRILGRRVAELHAALASSPDDPVFAPEPFTALYQRSIYQSMRTHARECLSLLRRRIDALPEDARSLGEAIAAREDEILQVFQKLRDQRVSGSRIRCHGDLHLGQVLFTGKDWAIIDFEGEVGRPLGERRIKRSPLRDVAGMLRSFHYAAITSQRRLAGAFGDTEEQAELLTPWASFWDAWVSSAFLRAYLRHASPTGLLPRGRDQLQLLLDALLLEKALYEVAYELNNRPDWVLVPLRGVEGLLGVPRRCGLED